MRFLPQIRVLGKMSRKVLLISFQHPDLVRGGQQQICYELFAALKKTQLKPIFLASMQKDILPGLFKGGAVITGFDGREAEFLFLTAGYDHDWHRNREPWRLEIFEEFLRGSKPDVIHFHHFMDYGLEYFAAARKYLDSVGGRLIFTLHEFLAICLAEGHMVRTFDGSLCNRASPMRCHQCFPNKTPEFFSMRTMWAKHHLDMVDTFVATSLFTKSVYVDWGVRAEKIIHIPAGHREFPGRAGVASSPGQPSGKRNRFGFFGQLIDSKGLLVLFDAIRALRHSGVSDFTVDINGANLEFASSEFRQQYEAFCTEEETRAKRGVRRVRFNGMYDVADLPRLMADIDWVLVPSKWAETFLMVVSEAFLFGKPVICSNIGVMLERIQDNINGLHFTVGSSDSLASVMKRAITEADLWDRLSANVLPPPTADRSAQLHMELCY